MRMGSSAVWQRLIFRRGRGAFAAGAVVVLAVLAGVTRFSAKADDAGTRSAGHQAGAPAVESAPSSSAVL